jgi:hypothetical protein
VDTSTEIPYTAPVLSSPTRENVPLKSIEFFLKFRIIDPILFVQRIGASNFDAVLSSAVQDAIRQRSRQIETARAYDLRGSNVEDMQTYLNRQMERYGVRIIGANIPDVQLPDQYRENLATRERIAKELSAYEKEWELMRKRRTDTTLMEIERAKKERDEKIIAVKESLNKTMHWPSTPPAMRWSPPARHNRPGRWISCWLRIPRSTSRSPAACWKAKVTTSALPTMATRRCRCTTTMPTTWC